MLMKKINTLIPTLVLFFSVQFLSAQELYVGDNSEFYLKKDLPFTTSNTTVSVTSLGKFSVEAGNNWGSILEYVNGDVFAYDTGLTKLPTGNNGVYAPVIADHTGDIVASYINGAPTSGTNGTNVNAVSDVEYWELAGNAVITLPWNSSSNITDLVNNNGGVLNAVTIVGLDSGEWNLVSDTQTSTVSGNLTTGTVTSDASTEVLLNDFSQFTFGIDNQIVLSTDDPFSITGIHILSNPIKSDDNIRFSTDINQNLKVTLYDFMGKKLRYYDTINTLNGIGTMPRAELTSGIYLLKFQHDGKQVVKKIILE